MAKNILIVPNRSSNNSSPYITFENTTISGLNVLSGATIAFSANTVSNVLSIQPSNLIISIGVSLNVRNYFSVGGTQVINATNVWIGPTTGLVGAQGAQGNTGGVGAQGPTGAQGNTGAQGAVGPIGAQGNLGPIGNIGPTGGTGLAGGQGAQGAKGPQGATGLSGSQGTQGTIGGQGAQGAQGATGAATGVGPQGATGPVGGQGAQGPIGGQGAQGPIGGQGAQGPFGAQGAQGPTGGQGAQGAQGLIGSPGPTGPVGPQGTPGPQGAQGATGGGGGQGAQGTAGGTGPTGSAGAQGAQGGVGITCTALSGRAAATTKDCTYVCGNSGTITTFYSRDVTACTSIVAGGSYIMYSSLTACQNNTTSRTPNQFLTCNGLYCALWNTVSLWDAPTSCSDARVKEAVEVLKDSLENIMKLDVVEYDWNDNIPVPDFYANLIKNKKTHSIGLIAQNVKKYFPEVVGINNGYYSINYSKLNAILVEAIKEQHIFIEDIDKELNFIKSKLN